MEVITTHVNADFDAMASMIAAKKLYPDAILVFPGSQERTLREFFVKSTVYIYDFKRLRDVDLSQVRRLILVDTRQVSRIGKFEELLKRPDVEIHVYDHHPDAEDDIQGQVMVIKPVGATVTLLTGLIREKNIQPSMSPLAAALSGLSGMICTKRLTPLVAGCAAVIADTRPAPSSRSFARSSGERP